METLWSILDRTRRARRSPLPLHHTCESIDRKSRTTLGCPAGWWLKKMHCLWTQSLCASIRLELPAGLLFWSLGMFFFLLCFFMRWNIYEWYFIFVYSQGNHQSTTQSELNKYILYILSIQEINFLIVEYIIICFCSAFNKNKMFLFQVKKKACVFNNTFHSFSHFTLCPLSVSVAMSCPSLASYAVLLWYFCSNDSRPSALICFAGLLVGPELHC